MSLSPNSGLNRQELPVKAWWLFTLIQRSSWIFRVHTLKFRNQSCRGDLMLPLIHLILRTLLLSLLLSGAFLPRDCFPLDLCPNPPNPILIKTSSAHLCPRERITLSRLPCSSVRRCDSSCQWTGKESTVALWHCVCVCLSLSLCVYMYVQVGTEAREHTAHCIPWS